VAVPGVRPLAVGDERAAVPVVAAGAVVVVVPLILVGVRRSLRRVSDWLSAGAFSTITANRASTPSTLLSTVSSSLRTRVSR